MATYQIFSNLRAFSPLSTSSRTRNSTSSCKSSIRNIPQPYSPPNIRLVQQLESLLSKVKEDQSDIKRGEYLLRVRSMFQNLDDPLDAMKTIDSLQRLGIDYLFKEEIETMLSSIHDRFDHIKSDLNANLFEVALSFRLLRQAGHHVSADAFNKFIDNMGQFNSSTKTDVKGLLSLHEASYLNMGEDILYRAKEFSSDLLMSCYTGQLEPEVERQVKRTLEHPLYKTLPRYNSPYYINQCQGKSTSGVVLNKLARLDFNRIQRVHQRELVEILGWWNDMGLAQELSFIRDQPLKWYAWPMTATLPDPQFSECRIELTKVIAFVYIIDDIFDVYGSFEELSLFSEAIKKWEYSAVETLPTCMQICFKNLYEITNEIAQATCDRYGLNPINHMKESWARLCDAFLKESKWFRSKNSPSADEYLRNAIVSSGVYTVLLHAYFLYGQGITEENANFLRSNPTLLSCPATILRLWDDLGSAKDENQQGFDGSYVDYLMKEQPHYSMENARDHVMEMISSSWESLNKECFSSSHFSPDFVASCLNSARMVEVMYSYDNNQNLPTLEEYINTLLFKSI